MNFIIEAVAISDAVETYAQRGQDAQHENLGQRPIPSRMEPETNGHERAL